MRVRVESPEVLYSEDRLARLARSDVSELRDQLTASDRRRIRLCAHAGVEDRLHDMVILMKGGEFVRPHKHLTNAESLHVLEGRADAVFFEDDGAIREVLQLGDYASGLRFYYRLAEPLFHTLLVRSEVLVFRETSTGPFDRQDTGFPGWAPAGADAGAAATFLANLEEGVKRFL